MKVRKIGVERAMLDLYQGRNAGTGHELLSLKQLRSLQHVEIQSSTVSPVLLDIPESECSGQNSTICRALAKLSMKKKSFGSSLFASIIVGSSLGL